MTHHHNHARKHIRLNADTRRKLDTETPDNDVHHHHHQHRDVHAQPETHTSNDSTADDEPAPIANHDIDRRNTEVVQTVTTYVATEYDLLIESGTSTLGEFTVSTLPAVITIPNFGVLTVPANAGSLVTGARPSPISAPVETNPAAAAATGASAMAASPNHQVPLVSSQTTAPISETSQPSATQSVASDTSAASSDVDSTVTTTAAAATSTSISPDSTTSGISTTSISGSISNSNPTSTSLSNSISDSNTNSAMTSTSGASATISSDASASTLFSTTDPASGTSTLSAGSTASLGDGATAVSATSSSSSTSTAGAASSGSSGGANETPKIVGGVVGGVLGALFLLAFAFFFLRWKRKRATAAGVERTFGRDGVLGGDTQSFKPRAPEMSSWRRSSNTPLAAGAFFKRQPSSPGYSDENATGERGFQKISGRKIQSVLHTGGNGYGDEIEEEPIPENPFEPGSPVSPMSAHHGDFNQAPLVRLDSGDGAMMRPSPARTATTVSSVDLMGSSPPWQLGVAPLRPDSVGRSLPRQDGSRNSRFTERI